MTKDEALKLALEALEQLQGGCTDHDDGTVEAITVWCPEVIDAIKEALAQPEQEPVAYGMWDTMLGKGNRMMMVRLDKGQDGCTVPLYTTPPQRKPLSNQKIIEMYNEPRSDAEMIEFARAIEAAHGIWPENSDCHGPDWTDRDGEYLK